MPRVIDDLVIKLAKNAFGRALARSMSLVVMDLARFTDTRNGDVVVTNCGISERRGIGGPAVKATIKLLLERQVVRKVEPAYERRTELQRLPGGFHRNRRYLIWNHQERWQLPRDQEELVAMITQWNEYLGRSSQMRAKQVPTGTG